MAFDGKVARGLTLALSLASFASLSQTAVASTVSCNIPQPCALYTNAQGPGVEGTSAKAEGVLGTTTFAGTSATARTYGVEGVDASTNKNRFNVGVYGSSPYGLGVYGVSPNGTGVYATSTSGYGLRAASSSGIALTATSNANTALVGTTSSTNNSAVRAGVMGFDASTANGPRNDGVLGTVTNGGYGVAGHNSDGALGGVIGVSTSGIGVTGTTTNDIAVYGESDNAGYGLHGYSYAGTGIYGVTFGGAETAILAASNAGPAFAAQSNTGDGLDVTTGGGVGAFIRNSNGNGTDIAGSYIGLLGRSDQYPLVLTNAAGNDEFYVDGSGNIYAHGSYNTFVATHNGQTTNVFGARTTAPTVEDVGQSHLVAGAAAVRFDAAFAASIDPQAPYEVFLTPGGDTRGLYVAQKSAGGFVVRESQSGRSTVDFDYRVVATTAGHAHERTAFVSTHASAPHAATIVRAVRKLAGKPAIRSIR